MKIATGIRREMSFIFSATLSVSTGTTQSASAVLTSILSRIDISSFSDIVPA